MTWHGISSVGLLSCLPNPGYVIDDETAITVVDGIVDEVSEGRWTLMGAAS